MNMPPELYAPDPQQRKQALQNIREEIVSMALLEAVEQLAARDPDGEVRAAAFAALESRPLRTLRVQRLMSMNAGEQRTILRELETWQRKGLLGDDLARTLISRYLIAALPAPQPAAQNGTPAAAPAAAVPTAESRPVAPVAEQAQPVSAPQPRPREPRPSLAQTLLSETSIKTFLYLGAFFVIAAAIILAALVETLRLPILSLAALAFGGAALALKKRLPQPSFVLFIVFSFILPINAGVFADLIDLDGRLLAGYWTFVLLVSAIIWIFATWFYNSRFFSMSALGAFLLASGILPGVFGDAVIGEAHLAAIQLANLAGLVGVYFLTRKRGWPFSTPAFVLGQLVNLLLGATFGLLYLVNLLSGNADPGAWLLLAVTALLAATYYAASHLLKPFGLFPWIASAAFTPVLYLVLSETDLASQHGIVFAIGWAVWATLLSALSEIAYRLDRLGWLKNKTRDYPLPLALAGLAAFAPANLLGVFDSFSWGFGLALAAALVLGLAQALRPRGWVWLTALLHGLLAYFLFFQLPFMPDLGDYASYKLALAAVILVLPDLLLRPAWKNNLDWFLPLRALAALLGLLTLFSLPLIEQSDPLQAALSALLLSGTYWLYAIRYQKPQAGYLPALLLALGLFYGLGTADKALGLQLTFGGLALLALGFALIGWALERFAGQAEWSRTLRWSGLGLALILAGAALGLNSPFEGWFVGLLALPFLAEARRYPNIELAAPLMLCLGFGLVLAENRVGQPFYFLGGMSMLWLSVDYGYKRLLSQRPQAQATYLGGGLLTGMAAIALLQFAAPTPGELGLALALSLFLLAYALLYRNAQLGYGFSALLAVSAVGLARLWLDGAWLWLLTPLALVYFGLGNALKSNGWGQTLRFSGLGLAALSSLAAPSAVQDGSGWFAVALALPWLIETWRGKRAWAEAGFYLSGLLAFGLLLEQYGLLTGAYFGFGMAVFLLGFDLLFGFSLERNPILAPLTRALGGLAAAIALLACLSDGIRAGEVLVAFGLSAFFGLYAPLRRQPLLGYLPSGLLAVSVLFLFAWQDWTGWSWTMIVLAGMYYLASLGLGLFARDWSQVLRFSGVGLGTLTSLAALAQGPSVSASIPIALAASLWAVEAFRRRNVWLGFPTNLLYLCSYFTLLVSLEVEQAQFYSVGAALLGLLMHFLLTRAGSDKGAFVTGLVSQLTLLGTTYIQMLATEQLGYFAALFFQALAVLVYGLVARSRSLVGVPIAMLVLGVSTIVLFILRGLSTVILIGCTGIVMILAATLAVVLRERLAQVGERLSGWRA